MSLFVTQASYPTSNEVWSLERDPNLSSLKVGSLSLQNHYLFLHSLTCYDPQIGIIFLKVNLAMCIKNLKILLPFGRGNGSSHFWMTEDLKWYGWVIFIISLYFPVFLSFINWEKRKWKKAVPMLLAMGEFLNLKFTVINRMHKNHEKWNNTNTRSINKNEENFK